MDVEILEAWTQVDIVPLRAPDPSLLLDVVEPLVHGEFVGQLESWHFFWEPALCVRFRWRDGAPRERLDERLRSRLDAARVEGRLVSWCEAGSGATEAYAGEAPSYGPEVWDLIQKDWMNGSELALRLTRLTSDGLLTGTLTPTVADHWNRHVHLFTNQLLGVSKPPAWWDHEIGLCLAQARGYLALSVRESGARRYAQSLELVDAALTAWSADESLEQS